MSFQDISSDRINYNRYYIKVSMGTTTEKIRK